jgi:putative component of toxin-antitoxin plasmid stabilization module
VFPDCPYAFSKKLDDVDVFGIFMNYVVPMSIRRSTARVCSLGSVSAKAKNAADIRLRPVSNTNGHRAYWFRQDGVVSLPLVGGRKSVRERGWGIRREGGVFRRLDRKVPAVDATSNDVIENNN